MLTPKLLRLDESMVQQLEELATKLSEKEYTSFSALVRQLLKVGMDDMKSSINSPKMKRSIIEAVEKALEECAVQHNANIADLDEATEITNSQPKKLKLTFSFYWSKDEKDIWGNNRPDMFCQPIIDLEGENMNTTNEQQINTDTSLSFLEQVKQAQSEKTSLEKEVLAMVKSSILGSTKEYGIRIFRLSLVDIGGYIDRVKRDKEGNSDYNIAYSTLSARDCNEIFSYVVSILRGEGFNVRSEIDGCGYVIVIFTW